MWIRKKLQTRPQWYWTGYIQHVIYDQLQCSCYILSLNTKVQTIVIGAARCDNAIVSGSENSHKPDHSNVGPYICCAMHIANQCSNGDWPSVRVQCQAGGWVGTRVDPFYCSSLIKWAYDHTVFLEQQDVISLATSNLGDFRKGYVAHCTQPLECSASRAVRRAQESANSIVPL